MGSKMLMHSWGRYPLQEAIIHTPGRRSDLMIHMQDSSTLLARGMGRSYGDSALAAQLIDTRRLDMLIDFDEANGFVCCEAGLCLAELLTVVVPKGWFLPVTPGTKFVSIGGAVASDVHGKNHHQQGCFSEHVISLDILLADSSILTCSALQNADLFHATCGGMGLTGIILTVRLKLQAIFSTDIAQMAYKTKGLQHTLELFEQHAQATYSVAWIDCLASGRGLGRAVLMLGEAIDHGVLKFSDTAQIMLPSILPDRLLNPYTVKAFNTLYYHTAPRRIQQRLNYDAFFYPLDRIQQWNRLYGKRGFCQYQCVLPHAVALPGLNELLKK